MRYPRHPGAATSLFLALVVAAGTAPGAATAQDAEQAIGQERLAQFAAAHVAINEARDEFHGQVARVHDEEGRTRAREEVDARIQEILEANEMTQEEYDQFILRISLDGELRAAFDELVAQLQETPREG